VPFGHPRTTAPPNSRNLKKQERHDRRLSVPPLLRTDTLELDCRIAGREEQSVEARLKRLVVVLCGVLDQERCRAGWP